MKRPRWALAVVLFLGVSLLVYGLARWEPFAPEAPAAGQAPPGDAPRGDAVYARACASCHGAAGEGGIGPALAGSGVAAGEVVAVVAAGRGAMPAGLVAGQDAADVAAYVASISGGDTGATTPPELPEAVGGGWAVLTGEDAGGVSVRLDEPAPADWTVWVEGPAGRRAVATIPAGRRAAAVASVDGASLLGRYDAVLLGTDPAAPALQGELAPGRGEDLRRLLEGDPALPGGASALDAAGAQVEILRDHVRFLVIARDEGNLANVRFHGEHIVNISLGEPVRDLDGNGDPSNPGDGLGLIDGPDAHLPRIARLGGPAVAPSVRELSALVGDLAVQAERCGTTATVEAARPAIAAIQLLDARLDGAWARLRERAERAAVIDLEPR